MSSPGTRARRASGNGAPAVLIAALATLACARTPPPPVEREPGPSLAEQNAAVLADRCVDALPTSPSGERDKSGIIQVGLGAKTAYGLTETERLRIWGLNGGAVTAADRTGFRALAADGSIAVTVEQTDQKGSVLEAWDLASNRQVSTMSLEDGGYALAVTSRTVLVWEAAGPCEECRDIEGPSPTDELALWDLASGRTTPVPFRCGHKVALSADGNGMACVLEGGEVIGPWFLRPAPEWQPPPKAAPESEWGPSRYDSEVGPGVLSIDSLQLSPRGDAVTYSYRGNARGPVILSGLPPRHGWRLERWTSAAGGTGKLQRLAQAPDTLCARLLAASPDGQLLIFGGPSSRPSIRRAPRYQAEPLSGDAIVLSAAVSPDGSRILTGHPDGRMRLWDGRTLRLLMTSESRPAE